MCAAIVEQCFMITCIALQRMVASFGSWINKHRLILQLGSFGFHRMQITHQNHRLNCFRNFLPIHPFKFRHVFCPEVSGMFRFHDI